LGFKLSKGGEEIALMRHTSVFPDTTDYILFGPQTEDVSYGRSYDASIFWVYFNTATPNASNGTISVGEQAFFKTAIYPNPYSDHLSLKNVLDQKLRVSIFNLQGQQLDEFEMLPFQVLKWHDTFSEGMRIVRVTNGTFTHVSRVLKVN